MPSGLKWPPAFVRVVAAVALFVNVEAVDAGRDAGEIGDDFHAVLAGILEVNGPFRGRAARRSRAWPSPSASAMGARGENERERDHQ